MIEACRGGRAARLAPAAFGFALTALALTFVRRHAVDWFYDDDLATLRWFAEAEVAASLAADARDPPAARCAAVAACFALAFQPTQMEHLLWSFEIGWFLVNAAVVADVALAERLGPRAAWLAAPLCAAASLASVQGAFAFFAASLHQALMPPRPGRRSAAVLLALGGLLAVVRLFWQPHVSTFGPVRPDSDLGGMAIFAVQVLGGLSGLRGRVPLLRGGPASIARSTPCGRTTRRTSSFDSPSSRGGRIRRRGCSPSPRRRKARSGTRSASRPSRISSAP